MSDFEFALLMWLTGVTLGWVGCLFCTTKPWRSATAAESEPKEVDKR